MAQTVRRDTLCDTPRVTVHDSDSRPSWRRIGTRAGPAALTLWRQPAGPVSVTLWEYAPASAGGRGVTRQTVMQIDRESIPALIELLQGALK